MTIYLGIDPGKGGAAVAINEFGEISCQKLDATEADISVFIRSLAAGTYAMIERVHAHPSRLDENGKPVFRGPGIVGAFTFGQGYGFLRGLLIAHQIPFEEVSPQKWQRSLGCLTGGDKSISKAKAQQLFPQVKVTNYIADALLIAEFCRRTRGGRSVEPPQKNLYDLSEI